MNEFKPCQYQGWKCPTPDKCTAERWCTSASTTGVPFHDKEIPPGVIVIGVKSVPPIPLLRPNLRPRHTLGLPLTVRTDDWGTQILDRSGECIANCNNEDEASIIVDAIHRADAYD